jgi:anti-sigma-K factor RskA
MDPPQGEDLDALARDYVSGALSPATTEGVKRRLRTDEALRKAVLRCEKTSSAPRENRNRSRPEALPPGAGAARSLWNDARFWRRLCALALVAVVALTAALILLATR